MPITPRRPIVGGNWKMHLDRAGAVALARAVADAAAPRRAEVVVFPALVHVDAVGAALREAGSAVRLGAQDCWPEPPGAFTGEVSIPHLTDLGVTHVLVGHSERRHVIGEPDELIRRKAAAVLQAGLTCVLCIGETLEQRERGETDAVNERQLRSALRGATRAEAERLVIAYEPVWAIGTGRTATPADAQSAHARARAVLADLLGADAVAGVRVQYGGSVTAANAKDLFAQPDVDGGLVGGASLKPADFAAILSAAG